MKRRTIIKVIILASLILLPALIIGFLFAIQPEERIVWYGSPTSIFGGLCLISIGIYFLLILVIIALIIIIRVRIFMLRSKLKEEYKSDKQSEEVESDLFFY